MSNLPKQNATLKQKSSSNSSSEQQPKDIIISIILSESTTSLLKLDLPHLEDLDAENSRPMICAIKAEANIEETNYSKNGACNKLSEFTKYWFCNSENEDLKERNVDCEKVSSEVAYLRSNPNMKESVTSLEDQIESKRRGDSSGTESCISLHPKLKPTKVYTRPLYAVHTVAHQDHMKSEANNIYISVLNSQANITNSGWVNVCRICHGGESIGDLLSPCNCRGSIALVHLECLERWLKESTNSRCELCQYHFQIIRQPKYSIPKSIFIFLRHPGDHLADLLFDVFAFLIYTPAAIASTYMLMLLCESVAKSRINYNRNVSSQVITFAAVFGMATIDFTYSSWFMVNLQKHLTAWRSWYRNHCDVKLILPERKYKRHRRVMNLLENEVD